MPGAARCGESGVRGVRLEWSLPLLDHASLAPRDGRHKIPKKCSVRTPGLMLHSRRCRHCRCAAAMYTQRIDRPSWEGAASRRGWPQRCPAPTVLPQTNYKQKVKHAPLSLYTSARTGETPQAPHKRRQGQRFALLPPPPHTPAAAPRHKAAAASAARTAKDRLPCRCDGGRMLGEL